MARSRNRLRVYWGGAEAPWRFSASMRARCSSRAIAARIWITSRSGDAGWFWKIAYDESFARSSPGVQLTLDLTRDLLADTVLAQTDSCATADHPMIDHLWAERLALADLLIAPSAARVGQFRVACQLEALRRTLIATAKRVRNLSTSS